MKNTLSNTALALSLLLALFIFSVETFAQQTPQNELGKPQTLQYSDGTTATVTWEVPPKVRTALTLKLEFKDSKNNSPVLLKQNPEVILFMPSMGHGAGKTITVPYENTNGQVEPGVYRTSRVFFGMDKDWEIRLKIKNTLGQDEMKSFRIFL